MSGQLIDLPPPQTGSILLWVPPATGSPVLPGGVMRPVESSAKPSPATPSVPGPPSRLPQPFIDLLARLADNDWLAAVRADQERRAAQGRSVALEAYLDLRPRLRDDAAAVLDLVHNEV